MSIKKDANDPRIPDVRVFPFWVAVVAGPGFDPPGLAERLARSLRGLMARKPAPGLLVPYGSPLAVAAAEVAKACGWRCECQRYGRTHRTTLAGLVAVADAVVVVGHGPDADRAFDLARWAGVPVRRITAH